MLAGLFLQDHYHETTELVCMLIVKINILKDKLHFTNDNFIQFHEQECQYFNNYRQLSVDDQFWIHYVQALDELAARKYVDFFSCLFELMKQIQEKVKFHSCCWK